MNQAIRLFRLGWIIFPTGIPATNTTFVLPFLATPEWQGDVELHRWHSQDGHVRIGWKLLIQRIYLLVWHSYAFADWLHFLAADLSYSNVVANRTAQNYTASAITYTISGNVGVAGATLSYNNNGLQTVTADNSANYSLTIPYNWSGTVTPSLVGYPSRIMKITLTSLLIKRRITLPLGLRPLLQPHRILQLSLRLRQPRQHSRQPLQIHRPSLQPHRTRRRLRRLHRIRRPIHPHLCRGRSMARSSMM